MAKFPKADEDRVEDVCVWEGVALELARHCGIRVPLTCLVRVKDGAVLLLERFDRRGVVGIPYPSGISAVQGTVGGVFSYLELVDFLEMEGAEPERDIRELWLCVLFSCAVGNTEDHMRNHGFLREGDGCSLSLAFDVNPTPGDGEKYLSYAIGFDDRLAHPVAALEACDYFRVDRNSARLTARRMARELSAWHRIAVGYGIAKTSIARMQSCFKAGIERLQVL